MGKREFYKDRAKKRRRRWFASNGEQIGASTQGYVNKQDCIDNAILHGYTK